MSHPKPLQRCHPPRILYRPGGPYDSARRAAKRYLVALAQDERDVFTHDDLLWVWESLEYTLFEDPKVWWYTLVTFLKQRRFLLPYGPTGRGRRPSYYLSEHAVRWLDWVKFDWSTRVR